MSGNGQDAEVGVTIVADLDAGRAEAERRLDIAGATLRASGVEPIVLRVDGSTQVAQAFGSRGAGPLPVILGDDRSIRAAIAGMMGRDGAAGGGSGAIPGRALGVLAAHAQVDFVRTFGIPPDQPAFAAERLLTAPPYPIDVVVVTYVDDSGTERSTHFGGVAEVGFGGAAVRRESRARIRRTAAFTGFWMTRSTFRAPFVHVTGERREYRGRAHDVIVGNTQYGRHGIRLSPRSFPGDGALDLLIMTGPPSQQVRLLPKMFQGEHVPDDSIREFRARRISVVTDRPVAVQADGVYLGSTPARFDLVPEAITLRI
jgi:diacylglycerol kinase (ATP)